MADEDNPTPITTADLVRLFEDLSSYEKEQIAAEMALPLWSKQRGRVYRDMKDRVNTRYLINGAEVTRDASGNQVGLEGGKGQFDIINFLNAVAFIDSASNARQLDVRTSGGLLCYDAIISTCWRDLISAGSATQGQVLQLANGCTVKLFGSFQASITDGTVNYIGACPGTYAENIVIGSGTQRTFESIANRAGAVGEWGSVSDESASVFVNNAASGTALTVNACGAYHTFDGIMFQGGNDSSPALQINQGALVEFYNSGFYKSNGTDAIHVTGFQWSARFDNCQVDGKVTNSGAAGNGTFRFRKSAISGSTGSIALPFAESGFSFTNLELTDSYVFGYVTLGDATGWSGQLLIDRSTIDGGNVNEDSVTFGCVDVHVRDGLTTLPRVQIRNSKLGAAAAITSHATANIINVVKGSNYALNQGVDMEIRNIEIPPTNANNTIMRFDGIVVGDSTYICGIMTGFGGFGTGTPTYYTLANGASIAAGAQICNPTGNATGSGNGAVGALATDAFVTIGHPADLPNSRAITAGTGITVTDGGAGAAVTIAATASGTNNKMSYIGFGTMVTGYTV